MIVLRNVTAVEFDPPRIRGDVDVVIDGRKIIAVGPGAGASAFSGAEVIDGSGKIAFPGIVCSHHHIYSALARGILANIGPTPDFVSILKNLWWRLDRGVDEPILRSSALTAALDALRCGTTAVIDHHASPEYIDGSLDVIQGAFETIGIRGATCYEVTDRRGPEGMKAGIAENRRFARAAAAHTAGDKDEPGKRLVEAHIGGHAPCTLPDAALEEMADILRETGRGLHLHVAEDLYDVSQSHVTYGKDIVERLDGFGLLNDKTILVHGVHLSDQEIEVLGERGGFLVHNARSNMNNAVGYNRRLPQVRNLALGTDGIGADMIAELQAAYFKHKDDGGPWWPGNFLAALQAGNRILEGLFGDSFGRLEEGFVADVVMASYDAPTPLVPENLAGHLVFGGSSGMTETVIVDGVVRMKDRRFTTDTDVPGIYAEAREQGRRLWDRMDGIEP